MGETKALPAQVGSRESKRGQVLVPQAGGSPGKRPRSECLWWGGSGQGPLGSLAGSRGTGPVDGRRNGGQRGSSPARGPPRLVRAALARDPGATHWPPLCGNQPGADGTRDQRPQHPAPGPHGGLPGPHELSPARPVPQDDTRIRTPLSRRRAPLPSASTPSGGRGRVGRWVGSEAPWASDIVFRSRTWGGEEAARGSLEGLGAPGRQEGTGRPWLGGSRPGRGSNQGVSQRPLLGGRFSSLRNTARRLFRVGAGPRPGGQTGRSGGGPPNASLLG